MAYIGRSRRINTARAMHKGDWSPYAARHLLRVDLRDLTQSRARDHHLLRTIYFAGASDRDDEAEAIVGEGFYAKL